MLRGASLGTTFLEPLGKRLAQIPSKRLRVTLLLSQLIRTV